MFEPRLHMGTSVKSVVSTQSLVGNQTKCKRSLFRCCKDNFEQFLLNTTLHGLKYIGDATITRLERYLNSQCEITTENIQIFNQIKLHDFRSFFICMFFLVVCLSAYFISNVWHKWNASPIIITQSAVSFSVKDFPFPGILNVQNFELNLFHGTNFVTLKLLPYAI